MMKDTTTLFYCFDQDLVNLNSQNDDTLLQLCYAKALGNAVLFDSSKGIVTDTDGLPVNINDKCLFLRTTSERAVHFLNRLRDFGCELIEEPEDITRLKHWFDYVSPSREIKNFHDTFSLRHYAFDLPWVRHSSKVFIKTVRKSYSAVISKEALMDDNYWIERSISRQILPDEEIVLSRVENIKCDQFGECEWRIFVLNNQVNCASRSLYSLSHRVPDKVFYAAERFVDQLEKTIGFPTYYVLDLMETTRGQLEIVELNPVSSSMCYVNNTIFNDILPEIKQIHKVLGIGYEYCLDALLNPQKYHVLPQPGIDYTYKRLY